jgi:hypothetical protein
VWGRDRSSPPLLVGTVLKRRNLSSGSLGIGIEEAFMYIPAMRKIPFWASLLVIIIIITHGLLLSLRK